MDCPKCKAGLVGFVDGTVKCPSCNFVGRLKNSNPDMWKPELTKYLDTQDDETVFNPSDIKVLVAHVAAYNNLNPPEEKALDQFLSDYISSRLGETSIAFFSTGVSSSYLGQVKEGTQIRHGIGRQSQSDGLFYEGYFKDDQFYGYGYGEGPTGSNTMKCGWWVNGQVAKNMHPKHVAINRVRRLVKDLCDSHIRKIEELENDNQEVFLYNADPDCKHNIVSGDNYSGIKCSKCPGWFCL